nr:hypothetical protein [Methylocella tundrae]
MKFVKTGSLLVMLMTPPVEPRPNRNDAGPFSTSISWMLNVSRVYQPWIAHAVAVEIIARRIAVDRDIITLRAALAAKEGDARHIVQRLDHGGILLVLNELLRDDGDALRGVEDRRRNALQAERARIVIGAAALALAAHVDLFKRNRVSLRGCGVLRERRVREHD